MPRKKKQCTWIADYAEYIEDRGEHLFCKKCEITMLNSKSSLQRHIRSKRHCGVSTKTQNVFNLELLKFILACNIPWTQIKNPIFNNFIKNCISGKFCKVCIPDESFLRRTTLDIAYKEKMHQIRTELANARIYVSVDESSDANGRQIGNVMVGALLKEKISTPHIISSFWLDEVNNVTISTLIKIALEKLWGNDHNKHDKVLLLLTDGVAYMLKAGKNLKTLFPNLVHVTCLAHGVNRVAEQVRLLFPAVNNLIAYTKKVFRKSPKRIRTFRQMLPTVPLPPQPTIIRWGTWINAACYYHKYLPEIKRVIQTFPNRDSMYILKVQRAMNDLNILNDLKWINNNISIIPNTIKQLQNQNLSLDASLNIVHKLKVHLSKLRLHPQGKVIHNKYQNVLKKNVGILTLNNLNNLISGREVELPNTEQIHNHYELFRFAPITTVDLERSFSWMKWILSPRRRSLKSENLEKMLIVYYENYIKY